MGMFTFCVLTVAICGHWPCIFGGLAAETIRCPPSDYQCENDRVGYEAIQNLHRQIDDDRDGSLDRSESDEFIRDELKYEDGFERQVNFHGTDDLISVTDLWLLWTQSDVYNWTVDDVIEWVAVQLELPQYGESLRVNAVDGRTLPRIASNGQYLSNILGIKNPVHKQKLALKAMDIVLFGPPKSHNYVKDLALVASLVVAVGGCWLAYVQHKYAQSHLSKVMHDLDTLQKSEDALLELQDKLEQAQQQKRSVAMEKETLEENMKQQIKQAMSEAERLKTTRDSTEEEIERLKLAEDELVQVRLALEQAERELESRQHAPLGELQQWLQLTYELESLHYEAKRELAVKQLRAAKDMCERIRKKRGAFLGSLRVAHTTSIDDTDHSIMAARSALEEVKVELSERSSRWKQIEKICGFNIILNPGLQYLESLLRTGFIHSGGLVHDLAQPMNLDEADEDMPPGATTQAVFAVTDLSLMFLPGMAFFALAAFFGHPSMRSSTHLLHEPLSPVSPVSPVSGSSKSSWMVRQKSTSSLHHSPTSPYPCLDGWATGGPGPVMMMPGGPAATGLAGLVQASMQLSMVAGAVNGGDSRNRKGSAAGFHGGLGGDVRVRNTSLARAFGSTTSLGQRGSGGASSSQLVQNRGPVLLQGMAADVADVSESEEHANGSVKFALGGNNSSSTTHLDDSFEALETMGSRPACTYTKSPSLDNPPAPRPSTLPKCLSSPPAPTTTRAPPAPARAPAPGPAVPPAAPVTQHDSSSPESTDSNSMNGDAKKKKKRKLFGKLMKRSESSLDKQKTT